MTYALLAVPCFDIYYFERLSSLVPAYPPYSRRPRAYTHMHTYVCKHTRTSRTSHTSHAHTQVTRSYRPDPTVHYPPTPKLKQVRKKKLLREKTTWHMI